MVLPLIITGGLIVVVLLFKDQIKNFADDLRDKSKDPANIEKQKKIDERGAIENTQAFILGEQGLKDLKERTAQNEAKVNQFLTDAQTNLNLAVTGVNTSLVQSQQNLENFAKQAQENIAKSINETGENIDTGIKATQTAIDTSIKETQTSIDSTFKGAQDFFGNLFNNPFGGQSASKVVVTETPKSVVPPKITTSPKGSIGIDLSFLTPNTSLKSDIEPKEVTMTQKASNQRQQRATRFN
jgi:hypothetical protein